METKGERTSPGRGKDRRRHGSHLLQDRAIGAPTMGRRLMRTPWRGRRSTFFWMSSVQARLQWTPSKERPDIDGAIMLLYAGKSDRRDWTTPGPSFDPPCPDKCWPYDKLRDGGEKHQGRSGGLGPRGQHARHPGRHGHDSMPLPRQMYIVSLAWESGPLGASSRGLGHPPSLPRPKSARRQQRIDACQTRAMISWLHQLQGAKYSFDQCTWARCRKPTRWGHWPPPIHPEPSKPGRGMAGAWCWTETRTEWTLKVDVIKADRRMEVLQTEWKYKLLRLRKRRGSTRWVQCGPMVWPVRSSTGRGWQRSSACLRVCLRG